MSRQQVFDKFSFLEGVVNEFYYRQIAETAIAMLAEQSPAVAQAVADEREGMKFFQYEAFTEATRQVQAKSKDLQESFARERAARAALGQPAEEGNKA